MDILLSFGACELRRCFPVAIVDDTRLEEIEHLTLTLSRIPELDQRITLNPMDAQIVIIDEDGNQYIIPHSVRVCMGHWHMHTLVASAPKKFISWFS